MVSKGTIIGYSGPPTNGTYDDHLHFGLATNYGTYDNMDYVNLEPFFDHQPLYSRGKHFRTNASILK
jgi:murein DD-endopeptidase MepM/ murein hydrolase activator NlpD